MQYYTSDIKYQIYSQYLSAGQKIDDVYPNGLVHLSKLTFGKLTSNEICEYLCYFDKLKDITYHLFDSREQAALELYLFSKKYTRLDRDNILYYYVIFLQNLYPEVINNSKMIRENSIQDFENFLSEKNLRMLMYNDF